MNNVYVANNISILFARFVRSPNVKIFNSLSQHLYAGVCGVRFIAGVICIARRTGLTADWYLAWGIKLIYAGSYATECLELLE